jgi:RNA polymerase sigma-70 factor (ECF subfamily)
MEIDRHQLHDEAYRSEVLTALLREYQDRIFRYCINRLGEGYGEEIAQEVFVTAWENLAKFRQEAALETWLTGIAKYKCIQALRNRTRRRAIAQTFIEDIRLQAHAATPEASERLVADQGRFARLTHGLNQLRTEERILLNLRYTKGLPISEIIELVGKSEAAVRKQLLRALQRLRKLIEDEEADG